MQQNINKTGPQSKIIAKAVIQDRIRKTFHIIAVFESSTFDEFYWIFKIKHPRSARKDWVYTWRYRREMKGSSTPVYDDFESFVKYYCRAAGMDLINDQQKAKRKVRALLIKAPETSLPSQVIRDTNINPKLFTLQNKRLARFMGRG